MTRALRIAGYGPIAIRDRDPHPILALPITLRRVFAGFSAAGSSRPRFASRKA